MSDINNIFEVIVLGGGPAGYVGAIRAAQKGYKVACISPDLGGTCLQEGCIPSKFLLHTSSQYEFIQKHAKDFGINASGTYELPIIMKKKENVIKDLERGIAHLFKKYGITHFQNKGRLISSKDKIIECETGEKLKATKGVLLATGSKIIEIPFNVKDGSKITIDNSRTALNWQECPEKLLVVGAGYIGLELASVWHRLGSKVTVVDLSPDFLPFLDKDVSDAVKKSLTEQGIEIKMGVSIKECAGEDENIKVTLTDDGLWEGSKILSAIGRRANVSTAFNNKDNENNWTNDIKMTENGFVNIDDFSQTNIDGIYAVGDIAGGALLAHKASDQAWCAIEHLYDKIKPENDKVIADNKKIRCTPKVGLVPSVIYLHPEVAMVGESEISLKVKNIEYEVKKVPFTGNSRAVTMQETYGFVKVLLDKKDKTILGVCVVGHSAESIVCQATIAMEYGATANDIASICYPHPSTYEAFREAMFAGSRWGILHG